MTILTRREFMKLSVVPWVAALYLPQSPQAEPNHLFLEASGGDDTQVLQAAFDWLENRYAYTGGHATLILSGAFHVSDTLLLQDKYRVRVLGLDCSIEGGTLDTHGSTYLTLERVHLTHPTALIYGRGITGAGGALHLSGCMIHGNIDIADADNSVFEGVTVYGETILRKDAYTYKQNSWRDCWLAGDVRLQGMVQSVSFENCYYTAPVIFEGDAYNVTFDNAIVENIPVWLKVTGRVNALAVRGLNISSHANPIIDVTGAQTNYNWRLDQPSKGLTAAKYVHIGAGAKLYGAQIVCGSHDIQNDGEIRMSFVDCLGTLPIDGLPAVQSQVVSAYYGKL